MLKVNPAICAENMKLWKKGASFMIRIGKKEKSDKLYQAILQLKDPQECYDFFQDLCTVSELRSMEQRFEVASLLNDGMIYSDILEQTGASSATISKGEPVPELRHRRLRAGVCPDEGAGSGE